MSRDIDVLVLSGAKVDTIGCVHALPVLREAVYGAMAGAHACTIPSTETDAIGRDELVERTATP